MNHPIMRKVQRDDILGVRFDGLAPCNTVFVMVFWTLRTIISTTTFFTMAFFHWPVVLDALRPNEMNPVATTSCGSQWLACGDGTR
ncbi:hypothetical protein BDR04DRAFT_194096 [Suillus decipiens]|nr:hypothetical protein BDR04DRAFT_194096 [Suillus decipiens]